MRDVERAVEVQRPRAEFIEFWFGKLKGLGKADAVAEINANGANVPVEGVTDLTAALQYGNHTNIQPYSTEIVKKIFDDIRFGRAPIFPRGFVGSISGLRISPMGVVVKPAKIRIIHDLTFLSSTYAGSVKADTAVGFAPDVELGSVLRDVFGGFCFGAQSLARRRGS